MLRDDPEASYYRKNDSEFLCIKKNLHFFFGFLSVLSLCLLGIGEIYESYPNFKIFIKIVATIFLTYLAYKIFISTEFSDNNNKKRFTFRDIYFFQLINPKAVSVSMSSSAIFISGLFSFESETAFDKFSGILTIEFEAQESVLTA